MLGEELAIPPQKQRYLEEYYQSLPIVPSDGHLMIMLTTFCEFIWKTPSFNLVTVEREQPADTAVGLHPPLAPSANDTQLNMKAMERRYAYENELLRAVSLGQLHVEDRLLSAFAPQSFEKRSADPVRNAKNYCIIMNTLLRKAAEQGGVHPIYLDRTSSDFGHRIETLTVLSEIQALMIEMFRTYCRLVRRHALQRYSPVVRKVILTVDADLSLDLSPHTIAEQLGLSAGYLSTLFHRETGKTLTAFVRERRIEHAAYLLASSDLQIQTVALHCGIMDVQYFSKLFKRQYRLTPTEYRQAKRQPIGAT